MMTTKIVILSLLGFANVYCQTQCSHSTFPDPNQSEASNVVSKYEPVPAAQQLLDREYLPPVAPYEFAIPQANQAQPVYVAAPQATTVIPKLQPLPQYSFVKPVYQPLPKLQPLPQPTYVKPLYQPLPKLQPLPSTIQPKYATQPLPKLQPFFSSPRPVVTTLKPLQPLPKFSVQPAPTFNRLPPLKPIQPFSLKQVAQPKSFQPRDNEVPQATNVLPKLVKPDLEPAAQTNRLSVVNPDKIRIHHYICDQGNAQQKFLCDIYKLWDIQHPSEITSNDLDNPGDNSNNNPIYAQLPTSPRTTTTTSTTTTTTTTTTPEPEQDIENLPGDSQINNAIEYLPPYSTTPAPTTTTAAPTTVEIPKPLVASSDDNINVIKPEYTTVAPTTTTSKEGYDYPKPAIPFTVPEREGYDYPKPTVPFSDGISFSTYRSSVPLDSRFSEKISQFPFGFSPLTSYSESVNYQPLPAVTSTTIAPDIFFKSNSELFRSPSFSYSYQPLEQSRNTISTFNAPVVSYNDQSLPSLSPYSFSTAAPPVVSYTSQPEFSQSLSTLAPLLLSKESLFLTSTTQPPSNQASSTTESPIKSNKASTEKPIVTSTVSTPLPASYNSQPIGQFSYFNSLSPVSYSFPTFDQSLSTIPPSSYNFDNSLGNYNSINYQPYSGQLVSNIPPFYGLSSSTESPAKNTNQISTEKSSGTVNAATPVANKFESQQFGQYYNPPVPSFNYYFQPIEQSVTPTAPFIYNFDQPLGVRSNYSSLNYQPLSGQSLSSQTPAPYSFLPPSQSYVSGPSYNFPSSFNSGLAQSQFISSESPAISYTSSTPSPFNFQTYTSTLAPQNLPPVGLSSGSQNDQSLSSNTKSGTPANSYTSSTPSPFNYPAYTSTLTPQSLPSFGSSSGSQSSQQSSYSRAGLSSFNSGLFQSQFTSSELPANTYTSSTSSPLNFQTYTSTLAPQRLSSFGSQSGQSSSSYSKSGLPSFNSGLFQSQFSSESPAVSYTSSTPSSFNFQTYIRTSVPQNPPSFGSSGESQSGQSSTTYPKSGLTFGPQVQSVANLKDLQATARDSSLDISFVSQKNSLFGDSQDTPRKSGSGGDKEDISLGNIEILKVKRKSSPQNH